MGTTPASRRSRTLLAVVLTAVTAVAVGCGEGGDASLPGPLQSDERPAADDGGSDSDYCAAVEELEATDGEALDDPATAVAALAALGRVAPEELQPSFDVLADVVAELGQLDESDPDDIAASLELVLDPAVQDAADRIDELTSQECGIDLGSGSDDVADPFDDDPFDDDPFASDLPDGSDDLPSDDGAGSGDIDLEHVDAVKDANSAASWSGKLTTTTIMNDVTVTLAADPSDPVTPEEAMAACEAVRSALVSINPQVTVEILNGEAAVAASGAGGSCARR